MAAGPSGTGAGLAPHGAAVALEEEDEGGFGRPRRRPSRASRLGHRWRRTRPVMDTAERAVRRDCRPASRIGQEDALAVISRSGGSGGGLRRNGFCVSGLEAGVRRAVRRCGVWTAPGGRRAWVSSGDGLRASRHRSGTGRLSRNAPSGQPRLRHPCSWRWSARRRSGRAASQRWESRSGTPEASRTGRGEFVDEDAVDRPAVEQAAYDGGGFVGRYAGDAGNRFRAGPSCGS